MIASMVLGGSQGMEFNTLRGHSMFKGAQYSLIIHEVLVATEFFPAGVQDETLKEESQRLASYYSCDFNLFSVSIQLVLI